MDIVRAAPYARASRSPACGGLEVSKVLRVHTRRFDPDRAWAELLLGAAFGAKVLVVAAPGGRGVGGVGGVRGCVHSRPPGAGSWPAAKQTASPPPLGIEGSG